MDDMIDVRADEVDAFQRNGVVALRNKFSATWLDQLRETISDSVLSPGPNLVRHTNDADGPGYYEDFWCWRESAVFTDFVHNSPAAQLAGQLLGAPSVNLVMDNWFMREAGSASRPPFHHDISYFDFVGDMCVLWLPLEPVTKEDGITFVGGSHLWGKHFMRVRFTDGHPAHTDQRVTVNGVTYEPAPDIESDPDSYDLIGFDLDPGDCIFFDMRTLHGGLATTVPKQTVHRYTLRMTAPNGRIAYRGDWAAEERAMFEAAGYGEGDRLAGDFFPRLWPRGIESGL